jgi:hypothetical protein
VEKRLNRDRLIASPLLALLGAAIFSTGVGAAAGYSQQVGSEDHSTITGATRVPGAHSNGEGEKVNEREDESVSEFEEGSANGTLDDGSHQVRIIEIMESWPLQLRVAVGASDYIVELSPEAELERGGGILSPGGLESGQKAELRIDDHQVNRLRLLE